MARPTPPSNSESVLEQMRPYMLPTIDKIVQGVRTLQCGITPTLKALEQGAQRLGYGDPDSMKTIVNIFNESSSLVEKATQPEFLTAAAKLTNQIVKELAITDDNGTPLTAYIMDVNETTDPDNASASGDTLEKAAACSTSLDKMTEPNADVPAIVSSLTSTITVFPHVFSQPSSSLSPGGILPAIFSGTAAVVEKALQATDAEGQSTFSEEEAQILIDVLHEHVLHMIGDAKILSVKIHTKQLLKELCINHDKLPRKLFLTNVQRDVTQDPVRWGSFADIYEGSYLGKPVALKRLRIFQHTNPTQLAKLKKNFCRETLIWSHSGNQRYVLPILGVNETCFKNAMCMVLPWMKHGSIDQFIEKLRAEGRFIDGQGQVHRWIYQIAHGLDSLHEEQVIHGDLRAGNVLIDDEYNARVADFGLSIQAGKCSSLSSTTGGGLANLRAPELVDPNCPSPPEKASDVYAFGCLCLELYTGKSPYSNLPQGLILWNTLNGIKPPRPQFYDEELMSDQLWSLVDRCLSRSPNDRPTARELVTSLGSIALA